MIISAVGVLLTSCKKKTDDTDNDTSAASDNALAEGTYNDVHNIADQAASGGLATYDATYDGSNLNKTTYPNITFSNAYPLDDDTMYVNFGPTNYACADGRNRRGTINVVYSHGLMYADSGSHHTITFTNYFVEENQILGSKTVTNMGHNSAGHPYFNISVNGTIIKAMGAGTITWVSNRVREWTEGYTTSNWADDTYSITGTASGTSASGNTFTASIGTPLIKKMSCHWIQSGTIDLTPSGKPVRHFDFGNTGCDQLATVTINGNVYNITLH